MVTHSYLFSRNIIPVIYYFFQFRAYVNKLRSKSTIYKKKRQVLQDLKAESGVVSRTVEILKSRDDNINKQLEALESKKGVAGYRDTQDELEKVGISLLGTNSTKLHVEITLINCAYFKGI